VQEVAGDEKGGRCAEGGGRGDDEPAVNVYVRSGPEYIKGSSRKTNPFGNPYTKPPNPTQLEYPINGGNDTINVIAHSINHPAVIFRQPFANVVIQSKICW
jgi:hypothetical protein